MFQNENIYMNIYDILKTKFTISLSLADSISSDNIEYPLQTC